MMSSWFGARQLLIFSSQKRDGFFVMINNFRKKNMASYQFLFVLSSRLEINL